MQNRAKKRQQYNCSGRALKRFADAVRKRAAAALVFVLCFMIAFSSPAYAAEKGRSYHEDTYDYCMRASDVTVGLSELRDLDNGQKQALVERTSGYSIYKWDYPYFIRGDSVSASGDFSSVDWTRAGSYTITVKLPAITAGITSQISYTLKIIDDLPDEPDPGPDPVVPPVMYRVTVRYLEEGTGLSLKNDYISPEMEEGSSFTISEDILLPPEYYEVVEIQGDLQGVIDRDRQIIVVCRKLEQDPDDPPDEPDPGLVVPPAMYRVTVRFLEEETEFSLKDDYISPEMEEGSSFTIGEDILLPPENYEVVEIQGDLQGIIDSDRQIIVVCRKLEQDPADPDDPTPVDPDDPIPSDPENPDGGNTPAPGDQEGKEDGDKDDTSGKNGGNSGKNNGNSGKNSGKGSGGKGNKSGTSGSGSSAGNKSSAGQGAAMPSAGAQTASQTVAAAENQNSTSTMTGEGRTDGPLPSGETVRPEAEAEIPAAERSEGAPASETDRTDMAIAGAKSSSDDSSLGGAVLPQVDIKKEKYPMWSLTLGAAEGGILAVLGAMIFSDLKVILWFEEKKKR